MSLTKLAMQYQQTTEGTDDPSVSMGLAELAGGSEMTRLAPSYVLGYQPAYHGTSKANADAIKQEGLRADLGGTGASRASQDPSFMQESKGHVHFTTNPRAANLYANIANVPTRVINELRKYPDRIREAVLNPSGEVLHLQVDYDKFDRAKADPHSRMTDESFKTTENVTPEEIVGSRVSPQDRLRYRLKRLPQYMQQYPKRFAAGLALGGGGLGLAALGSNELYNAAAE